MSIYTETQETQTSHHLHYTEILAGYYFSNYHDFTLFDFIIYFNELLIIIVLLNIVTQLLHCY